MNKPKTPAQMAYDTRRAEEKAKRAKAKAETDAAFADEDAQVATVAKSDKQTEAAAKKDHEAKVKAQRAAEKIQRVQDEKDRQARLVIDKAEKKATKEKAKAAKLEARAAAKIAREASKVPRRHTEESLIAKYGARIVPGTLRFETEGTWNGKQTVEINTYAVRICPDGTLDDVREDFDGNTRRIATSDLFQVFHTEATLADLRRSRAKESRLAKKVQSA